MPHQLEAFAMSKQARIPAPRMLIAILVATVLGVTSAFWMQLHLYYKHGAESRYFSQSLTYGKEYMGRLTNWIAYPTGTEWVGLSFVGVGFGVVTALTALRMRFFWVSLHPLGYLLPDFPDGFATMVH